MRGLDWLGTDLTLTCTRRNRRKEAGNDERNREEENHSKSRRPSMIEKAANYFFGGGEGKERRGRERERDIVRVRKLIERLLAFGVPLHWV